MTPAQIALNNELKETETIKDIHVEVGSLKDGQEQILNKIDENEREAIEQFEKGSEMFKDLYSKVDKMETQIKNGFDKQSKQLSDFTNEIKDSRIENLSKKLEKKDDFWSGVTKTVLGGAALIFAAFLFAKLGITPKG